MIKQKRPIKLARLKIVKRTRKDLFRRELEKHGFLIEKVKDIRKNHPDLFKRRKENGKRNNA